MKTDFTGISESAKVDMEEPCPTCKRLPFSDEVTRLHRALHGTDIDDADKRATSFIHQHGLDLMIPDTALPSIKAALASNFAALMDLDKN